MSLHLPKAMFFDWDGTLVDSYTFLYRGHNYAQRQLGIGECTLEEFGQYFGRPREQLYKYMYAGRGEEAKVHFETFVKANHLKDLEPMEGAEELLQSCQEFGITCGLVTNKKGDFVRAEVKNFGWDAYFASIVGAAEAEADKPSGAPLLLAIQRAGISHNAEKVWYVGDTETDLQCAKDAGYPAVFVQTPPEIDSHLQAYEPILIVKNCNELRQFLLQCSGN